MKKGRKERVKERRKLAGKRGRRKGSMEDSEEEGGSSKDGPHRRVVQG